MGSGISSVCGSKRSVLIANSVRKLPTIPEDDFDIDADLEINHVSNKLHPAESRDSGIGENDVPHFLFQRTHGSGFLKNSSSDSSPEKGDRESEHEPGEESKPSRPHSCRLGHRGHKGTSRKTELSDSQIRRMVRSARRNHELEVDENGIYQDDGRFSDDTLSNHSSPSPTRNNSSVLRPKSAGRRRANRRRLIEKGDALTSLKTVSDLDSSTDTEISDTDMLSIPDETGSFNRSKDSTPQRRGWVRTEDFTDVILSTSRTPRVGAPTDMYRIVSGTYSDADVNLAKKASERSISSIILTPLDGTVTPTNSECCDPPNDMYYHCEGSLEDLVSTLVIALERIQSRGPCTSADYENIMKTIRYQLVAMAMGYMCRQSTPRIEVKGEQTNIFSDDSWRVQIRLRTEDEEIIEASEKALAQKLTSRTRPLSREDVSVLLADHLKTIEKLQQVQDAGKLREPEEIVSPKVVSSRKSSSEKTPRLRARPGSASKQRKLESGTDQSTYTDNHNSELPPSGPHSKGNKSRQTSAKQKLKAIPVIKGGNKAVVQADDNEKVNSPVDSLENRYSNKKSYNESGIDSEAEETDLIADQIDEDARLYQELTDAIVQLWDCMIPSDISDLLKEYRRREKNIVLSILAKRKQNEIKKNESNETCLTDVHDDEVVADDTYFIHPDQLEAWEKNVGRLDADFVKWFQDRQADRDLSLEDFSDSFTEHMKKTRLIRVQSFTVREDGVDWNGNQRANSFTGFGSPKQSLNNPTTISLKRQHSFSGPERQNIFSGSSRQNSFIKTLPVSRQNSYCRSRSRGSTGSSYTYSTTSSGVSSGLASSESSERSNSFTTKSALSREFSYGLLNDFEDIEEKDEDVKTARTNNAEVRTNSETLLPPSGRKSSNGPRATSGNLRDRDRRRGQTQVHGLGLTSVEASHAPLRKIEEDSLPKVEELDSKLAVRSRPDSGIAVSTSSASYSSSEPHKERDLEEQCLAASCQEMVQKVSKVLPDQHNDLKSLVAAVTKGLLTPHSKAQALYCWLTSQDLSKIEKTSKKSSSPASRLKHLLDKKTSYCSLYMDMLKIAGLKCERVEGYVKSADYLPGNTVQTTKFQHSWVAVCMDGHYRLVDPQYGALRDKFVQEHYFATSPDELILSHFPKDKRWLLMNQPATIEVFEGTVKTWPAMFHFNIRPLNMKSVIRTYDGRLSITVLLQNVAVNPQLEYAGPGPEIDSDTLEEKIDHEIRDVDNAETYHVTLPQEGNYYFTVFAHVLEDCIDIPVFQYRIEYVDELL